MRQRTAELRATQTGMSRATASAVMRCADSLIADAARRRTEWSAASQLLAHARPLIITDLHGRGLCELLRATNIPVWIEGSAAQVRRVLACIDPFASPAVAYGVLEVAQQLGRATGAELFAVHAWDAPGEHLLAHHASRDCAYRYATEHRETARRRFDEHLACLRCDVAQDHRLARRGDATMVITRLVDELEIEIDAIVLGMTARPRLARALLGCTAVRVAAAVSCHVVVLPSAEALASRVTLPVAIARRRSA